MADGIRLRWIPGLNTVGRVPSSTLPEQLTQAAFAVAACVPGSSVTFHLPTVPGTVPTAFAAEINRFSSASFETVAGARSSPGLERSLGCPLIRCYYGAFFAAHALLRITGESITYVPQALCHRLDQLTATYIGMSPRLGAGLYHVQTSTPTRTLSLTKIGAGGGSHEFLWQRFYTFLTNVENELALNFGTLPEAVQAIQTSNDLRSTLSRAGASQGTWLSHSRNAINYRHLYGVWYPYGIRQDRAERLDATIDRWRHDEGPWETWVRFTDDIQTHLGTSQTIVALLRATLLDLSHRNGAVGRSFVDAVPLAFLRWRRL